MGTDQAGGAFTTARIGAGAFMVIQPRIRLTVCLVLLVGFFARPTPVRASIITLDFSGTADIPFLGEPVSRTYSGSISWDTATFVTPTGVPFADYALTDLTFAVNGQTVPLDSGTSSTGELDIDFSPISICDSCVSGYDDIFTFFVNFKLNVPLVGVGSTARYLTGFTGVLLGPTGMLNGTALPTDAFLADVTSSFAFLCYGGITTPPAYGCGGFPLGEREVLGSLDVASAAGLDPTTPVPEPATFVLLSAGLGLTITRRLRRA